MTQQESGMNLQNKLQIAASNLERTQIFQKGDLKRGGENMHFSASEASEKMIMGLFSSASDICNLYGICDSLGKINKVDLESRRDSASIVLTPRVSDTASLSRANAADNFLKYAGNCREESHSTSITF